MTDTIHKTKGLQTLPSPPQGLGDLEPNEQGEAFTTSFQYYSSDSVSSNKRCIMSSNHLLFRGLKAYLSKWKARGFDNDVKRLVSLLEAGSIAQAEQMVRKLKNYNYDYS